MTKEKTQKELILELKDLIKLQASKQVENKKELQKRYKLLNEKILENPDMYGWQVAEKFDISMQLAYTKDSRKFNNRIHLLAYGFLRGLPYIQMENKTKSETDWDLKNRARHVCVIYSAHYADDSRIQKLTEEDIRSAFHGGNDGN